MLGRWSGLSHSLTKCSVLWNKLPEDPLCCDEHAVKCVLLVPLFVRSGRAYARQSSLAKARAPGGITEQSSDCCERAVRSKQAVLLVARRIIVAELFELEFDEFEFDEF